MFSSNSSQVSNDKLYVEDVFSTYLYAGTGGSLAINNGIDLAGKGGMVWIKDRGNASNHAIFDTARGTGKYISSNGTAGQTTDNTTLNAFYDVGFGLSSDDNYIVNAAGMSRNYASWTFRKAAKFFDVVTWTGDGTNNRQIAHALGVAPGMVVVKNTSFASDWKVWHTAVPTVNGLLNQTVAFSNAIGPGGPRRQGYVSSAGATSFTLTGGTSASDLDGVNASGSTYVAYLFAHDATADGVIQCGSYTSATGGNDINLGWEPQFILEKRSSGVSSWHMWDTMRGMSHTNLQELNADLSNAEATIGSVGYIKPTATGYNSTYWDAGNTIIYIAIRRGPMRTPTTGTSVFAPVADSSYAGDPIQTNFVTDLVFFKDRASSITNWYVQDRLRGVNNIGSSGMPVLATNTSREETAPSPAVYNFDNNVGFIKGAGATYHNRLSSFFAFRRAPGFFDMVCYSGTGVLGRTVYHNLGVAPEMMIIKRREDVDSWAVYHSSLGPTKYLLLPETDAANTWNRMWSDTAPTASVFSVGDLSAVNSSTSTYVAYLFASCPGVSKVGSYTGNGSSQTINCGFTNGARFFLVRRTDSAGDWWVWDTARGITAPADPALRLNSTAAETTSADAVDPASTGIVVNQESTCNINVNGASYIYLAIA